MAPRIGSTADAKLNATRSGAAIRFEAIKAARLAAALDGSYRQARLRSVGRSMTKRPRSAAVVPMLVVRQPLRYRR